MTCRAISVAGDIAFVPLTQGYTAIVDAADLPLVEGFNWSAMVVRRRDGTIRTVYATRKKWMSGKKHTLLMHRIVLGTPDGLDTDHRDGDGLNNRRHNLRPATQSQNQHNQRLRVDNSSGVKGVTWHAEGRKWQAKIMVQNKERSLGLFASIEAAAEAYARASACLHGDFGRVAISDKFAGAA